MDGRITKSTCLQHSFTIQTRTGEQDRTKLLKGVAAWQEDGGLWWWIHGMDCGTAKHFNCSVSLDRRIHRASCFWDWKRLCGEGSMFYTLKIEGGLRPGVSDTARNIDGIYCNLLISLWTCWNGRERPGQHHRKTVAYRARGGRKQPEMPGLSLHRFWGEIAVRRTAYEWQPENSKQLPVLA